MDYERHGSEDDVRRAVVDAVDGAAAVFLPGSPLSHPDHEWLVRALGTARLPGTGGSCTRSSRTLTGRRAIPARPRGSRATFGTPAFERVATGLRDRVAKWRAIRRYASQLPLLAMERSLRRGAHTLALHAELVAWQRGRDRAPG